MITEPANVSVRTRALQGVQLLILRTVFARVLGLLTVFLLAGNLGPSGLGTLAVGFAILTFGSFLADLGLGASLLRQATDPTAEQYASLAAVQLSLGSLILLMTAIAAFVADLPEILVMVTTIVIAPLRTTFSVQFERQLDYGKLAAADIVESVTYAVAALALVLNGLGPMGAAIAMPIRAISGVVFVCWVARRWPVRPSSSTAEARKLVGFGFAFGLAHLVNLLRDQGLNIVAASFGGLAGLGLLSLSTRVLQVPAVLTDNVYRVSFPAMARYRDEGGDMQAAFRGIVRSAAAALSALIAVTIPLSTILLPAILGSEWVGTAWIVVPAAVGVLLAGPMSLAATSYFYVLGVARVPLSAASINAVAGVAGAAAGCLFFGIRGLGVGFASIYIADLAVFVVAFRYRGLALTALRWTAGPAVAALLPSAAAIAFASTLRNSVTIGAVSVMAAVLIYAMAIRLFAPWCWATGLTLVNRGKAAT